MVAHAIVGSHLWSVKPEPQTSRNDATRESVETCKGETDFDAKRRAVLGVLGFSAEEPTVTGGTRHAYGLVGLFLPPPDLPDRALLDLLRLVLGEPPAVASPAVVAVGPATGAPIARSHGPTYA